MIGPTWASNPDSPITVASSAYRDATNSTTEAGMANSIIVYIYCTLNCCLLHAMMLVSLFPGFSSGMCFCLQNAEICDFPSRYFYNGQLETPNCKDHALTIWPNVKFPMVFCHVEGSEIIKAVPTPEGNEQSRRNEEECRHVVRIFVWS